MKPYSYYALFISTLLVRDQAYVGDGVRGAESDIVYYLTEPFFPEAVQSLHVDKINYTTLNFTWTPPSGKSSFKIDTTDLNTLFIYAYI